MKTNTNQASRALATLSRLILPALLFIVMLASCGSGDPTPESVAAKIDGNEELSQKDYGTIIDYCGEYAKKAQDYFNILNEQPNDSTRDAVAASNDLAALYAEYKYIDLFRTTLFSTSLSALDKDNAKKVEELSTYEAFPLPGGAGTRLENPDVVGMIEETPNSDTTGVISQGDGEAVDVKVK